MSEIDRANEVLDAAAYVTLATADADGRPWATPVWFAPESLGSLLWISRPETRHSQNLAARSEVSAVVFDSRAPISTGTGVYFDGTAAIVPDDELAEPTAVYSERAVSQGGIAFEPSDFTEANGRNRMFRLTATAVWLGERDERMQLELD